VGVKVRWSLFSVSRARLCSSPLSVLVDSNIHVWHRQTGKLIDVLEGHKNSVNSVSWNPVNAGMLASASDDRTVKIWVVRS